MSERADPFNILGVTPRAEKEVVEAAFKALMAKYHPDRNPGHEVLARKIIEAHDILTDPVKRARYERERDRVEGGIIGSYRIIREIAEGGFGRTYQAEHLTVGEPVCLKHCSRITTAHETVLIEEAKAVWDIRHLALPTMRDLFRHDDGSLVLVMSYITGPTLYELVEQKGPLEAEHVAWIGERTLNALAHLHYNGVIHGDIKPHNIIVQPEKHSAVLVDFGSSLKKPTATSSSKGYTEYFAPPEEIQGLTLVPESDLYSLGMTLLFALTGDLSRVRGKDIPARVPDPFSDFIGRLIRQDVRNRPSWDKEELLLTYQTVRQQSFGRAHSGMKAI